MKSAATFGFAVLAVAIQFKFSFWFWVAACYLVAVFFVICFMMGAHSGEDD